MSLIKLAMPKRKCMKNKVHQLNKTAAFLIPAMNPLVSVGLSGLLAGPGVLAAKSGHPLEWFLKSVNVGPIRKRIGQPLALATYSNSVNRLRNGYVADSTRIGSSILDAAMGQTMNFGLGTTEEQMKKSRIFRGVLDKIIDNSGRYDIPAIESSLKVSKALKTGADKVAPHNLALYGAGAGAGYKILTKHDDESGIWEGIKGGVSGGLVGMAGNKGVKMLREGPVGTAAKIHDVYFKNDYWKTQLVKANKGWARKSGQLMSKTFTSLPADRAKRIKNFNNMSSYMNEPIQWKKELPVKNWFKFKKTSVD